MIIIIVALSTVKTHTHTQITGKIEVDSFISFHSHNVSLFLFWFFLSFEIFFSHKILFIHSFIQQVHRFRCLQIVAAAAAATAVEAEAAKIFCFVHFVISSFSGSIRIGCTRYNSVYIRLLFDTERISNNNIFSAVYRCCCCCYYNISGHDSSSIV